MPACLKGLLHFGSILASIPLLCVSRFVPYGIICVEASRVGPVYRRFRQMFVGFRFKSDQISMHTFSQLFALARPQMSSLLQRTFPMVPLLNSSCLWALVS